MNNKMKTKNRKHKKLKLEDLKIPSYEATQKKVLKKVGKRPKLPKGLPKGIWSEQSLKVLSERYLQKNDDGKVYETPEEMCWRVSWNIASAESLWGSNRKEVIKSAKKFYHLLTTHEFLPNSPTLMNAGTGNGLQYSACFVLPVDDSLVGIFDAIKYQGLIHQTGGGTGFAFSRLRPRGAMVKRSHGTASGPISFMRIFDSATNEIKQGGKRRGANMGILRVDHPDILEFIHCKEEGGVTNFNISVAITDKFMKAYEKGTDYELVDPHTNKVVGKLDARKVFDEIAEGAWKTGDPGLIFLDKINKSTANPVPSLGPIESTNPCGEQPLYPYDSCNLGSIFLTYFVKDNGGKKEVDWEKLKKVAKLATKFLDGVIEMNPYPLEEIRRTSLAIRRIGLGVGGWADMLIQLGIPYDSQEALNLGEKVMKTIQDVAVSESESLAKVRGAFPMYQSSIYKNKTPRRNSTVTTIAPTGTISIIAGSSSGIEPLFAIAYQHIVKDKHLDRTLTFVNPYFEEKAKEQGIWDNELKEKVTKHGTIRGIEEVPDNLKEIFGTAHEMHHDWHIRMQTAFQKYTENAVSKTINMDNKVTEEDIKNAYLLSWQANCKGITVFRDGCKDAQVLNVGIKKDGKVKEEVETPEEPTRERPFAVFGSTYKLNTPVGNAFITINHDAKGNPLEIFINVGKAGSDVTAMAEALGRTISTTLRFRGNLDRKERAKEIAEQLAGIGGRRSVGFGPTKILSLPDAVAAAISTHLGLRINGFGFDKKLAGNYAKANGLAKENHNGHSNGDGIKNGKSEVRQDLAEAVMLAQTSVTETRLAGQSGHTMASAESSLASEETNHFSEQLQLTESEVDINNIADICPSCGAGSFVYQEGCAKCLYCGHSEC